MIPQDKYGIFCIYSTEAMSNLLKTPPIKKIRIKWCYALLNKFKNISIEMTIFEEKK